MEVNSATRPTSPSLASTQASKINSDYETFLKMLTAQLKNQDPLNPVDSADYAVQLATFSGVEQSVRTNQLLEGLQSQFGVLSMSQLAGWVGQEARSTAPVYFDGTAITLSPAPDSKADRAVLVVRDANNTIVSREDVPLSGRDYAWTGTNIAGNLLPSGVYKLSLESYRGDEMIATGDVEAYARIQEAQGGSGGTRLILLGGIEVAAEDVTALRVP